MPKPQLHRKLFHFLPLTLFIITSPLHAQVNVPAAVTACMSHLPASVSGEARKAAQTDCTFAFDSQLGAADTWAANADDHVATSYAKGRDELRAFWARIYAQPGFKLEWWPLTATQHGSFVVTTGEARHTTVDEQGKTHVTTGHYITVWKRQPDGTYKFVWDAGE